MNPQGGAGISGLERLFTIPKIDTAMRIGERESCHVHSSSTRLITTLPSCPSSSGSENVIMTGSVDWGRLMETVARELLGEPNARLSSPARGHLRYGSHGSMSIHIPPHPHAGQWYDFEACTGGGLIGFVAHVQGMTREEAIHWLRDRGHLGTPYTRLPAIGQPDYQDHPRAQKPMQRPIPIDSRQGEALRRLAQGLWGASEPLPMLPESPAGRWRDNRNLWRSGHSWPANLRGLPADALRQGWRISPGVAGAIVAPLATVDDWQETWPTSPEPAAIHLVAIDNDGYKAWAWESRDKTRLNMLPDMPRAPAWVIGASPDGLGQAVVVEGVADALGVASRVAATVIATTNVGAMQASAENGLGEVLARWEQVMVYADDDRRPDRKGAPPGLRGGAALRRAIQAAGGTAEVRHLPGGKDAADWAAANPFLPLDEDACATYAQSLREMHPQWPRWEIARRASIETTTEEVTHS